MSSCVSGADLVDKTRFKEVLDGQIGLIDEIFTDREKAYCRKHNDPLKHLAACFAVKEACLKALGMGLSGIGIDRVLRDIEFIPDSCGKAQLFTQGWVANRAVRRGITRWAVSVSHCSQFALATVVAQNEVPVPQHGVR